MNLKQKSVGECHLLPNSPHWAHFGRTVCVQLATSLFLHEIDANLEHKVLNSETAEQTQNMRQKAECSEIY